jgi:hypothetical protein
MSEIIEVMARADVDYFWREGGQHLDGFTKPIADGVRKRMAAIVEGLDAAEYKIRGPGKFELPEKPADTVRKIAKQALNDAIEITRLIALMRGQNADGVNQELEKAGAGQAGRAFKNALLARLVTMIARTYSEAKTGDLHVRAAIEILKKDATSRQIFQTGDGGAKLAAFEAQWTKCRGDHRLPKIKEFRDKYTAHLGEPKEDLDDATYAEVFAIGAETAKVMELLALAAKEAEKPLDSDPNLVSPCDAFWARWKQGKASDPKNPYADM